MAGNCDYLTPHQLHQKAWPLMEPSFERDREAAAAKYRQLAGTGKASGDIRQIVPAANEGRIEALIVDVQAHQWGRYDPQAAHVELHENREDRDADLLDLAVAKTLANRGKVYAVERGLVPSGESAAATFRY
jgi:hypothetical protein